jgi:hypothetical protein
VSDPNLLYLANKKNMFKIKLTTSLTPLMPQVLRFPDTRTQGRMFPLPFHYLTGISSPNLGSHDIADQMLKVAIIADNPNPL